MEDIETMKELQMKLKPNRISIISMLIIFFIFIVIVTAGLIAWFIGVKETLHNGQSIFRGPNLVKLILFAISLTVFIFGEIMLVVLFIGYWTAYKTTIELADETVIIRRGVKEFKVYNNTNTYVYDARVIKWLIWDIDKAKIKILRISRGDWGTQQFEVLQSHLKSFQGYGNDTSEMWTRLTPASKVCSGSDAEC